METIKLTREALYEMVWKEPMSSIAKRYNITDTGLRKACKRMNIPTPSNGHWMKLAHGEESKKEELPAHFEGEVFFEIEQVGKDTVISGESELSRIKKEVLADVRLDLTVPLSLKNACSLVVEVNEALKKRMKSEYYKKNELLTLLGPFLDVKVTSEHLNRMLRFADALIKNLKKRGHEIRIEKNETKLYLFGEKFQIVFRECLGKKINENPKYSWETSQMVPTGILSFRTAGFHQREWKEGKLTLEEQLPHIIAQLEVMGLKRKREMDMNRAQWAERERKEELYKQQLELKQTELRLFKNLKKESKRFNKAQRIRKYIVEVESRFSSELLPSENTLQWIQWAKDKADWLDPLVAKKDSVLDDYKTINEPEKTRK